MEGASPLFKRSSVTKSICEVPSEEQRGSKRRRATQHSRAEHWDRTRSNEQSIHVMLSMKGKDGLVKQSQAFSVAQRRTER
jgi:hypothetical protein